jgi:hypothetical protein
MMISFNREKRYFAFHKGEVRCRKGLRRVAKGESPVYLVTLWHDDAINAITLEFPTIELQDAAYDAFRGATPTGGFPHD